MRMYTRPIIALLALSALVICGCAYQSSRNSLYPLYPLDSSAIAAAESQGRLVWPIDCEPGVNCTLFYPDVDGDGKSNCGSVGYSGHEGTDIVFGNEQVSGWTLMDRGVAVRAAADGVVQWVFDGKYDRCENYLIPFITPGGGPDCQDPTENVTPGSSSGYRVCTEKGNFCRQYNQNKQCVWCFAGGNVVVIRHDSIPGVFATRYDHLKNGSISVKPGDRVVAGQKIAEVGSAGRSSGPHLHFEVWSDWYSPVDPWASSCGTDGSLWLYSIQPQAAEQRAPMR